MKRNKGVWLFLGILGSITMGCGHGPTDASRVTVVRAETSFGFCQGYCLTSLEIADGMVTYTRSGRSTDVAPITQTARLSDAEWDRLSRSIDRVRLEGLPGVIGCPDCADGGAESLEVVGPAWRKSVQFEFGARVPDIQAVLDEVRGIRRRFEP